MKNIFESEFFLTLRELYTSLSDKLQKITIFNRTPGKKVIIIGFTVIILALALFSVITLIDENIEPADGLTTDIGEIDPAILNVTQQQPIKATFLLALTNSDKTELLNTMVVNFDSEKANMFYYFLPSSAAVSVSGIYDTLSGHLATGGTNQLIHAASEYTEAEFDRYIIVPENALGNVLESLGETQINIDKRISYEHNGVSFIIDSGLQTLTPDMLLKYYLYLVSSPEENGSKITEVIVGILEKITSFEDDAELENKFCTALGYFDTNISALDFTNNKETIKAIPLMKLGERAYQIDPAAQTE